MSWVKRNIFQQGDCQTPLHPAELKSMKPGTPIPGSYVRGHNITSTRAETKQNWSLTYRTLKQTYINTQRLMFLGSTRQRNLGLTPTISDYLRLSPTISDYLRLSRSITDYLRLFLTVSYYLQLSQSISDYLVFSRTISDDLRLSSTIYDYL